MAKEGKILVIDDDKAVLVTAQMILKHSFYEIVLADRPDNALDEINRNVHEF